MAYRDKIIVGMRTGYDAANGRIHALVIIAGDDVGTLLTGTHLNGAALDIGKQVEIVASDPAPFELVIPNLKAGALLCDQSSTSVYYILAKSPVGSGRVCLASADSKFPVGEFYQHFDINTLIGIDNRIDLKLRDSLKQTVSA
jgi:hypothetical protein